MDFLIFLLHVSEVTKDYQEVVKNTTIIATFHLIDRHESVETANKNLMHTPLTFTLMVICIRLFILGFFRHHNDSLGNLTAWRHSNGFFLDRTFSFFFFVVGGFVFLSGFVALGVWHSVLLVLMSSQEIFVAKLLAAEFAEGFWIYDAHLTEFVVC